MISKDQMGRFWLIGRAAGIVGILLLWVGSLLTPEIVSATTIYSYVDEQGIPVLTDNFESIPERYRVKVQRTEKASTSAPDHSATIRLQQKIAGVAHTTDAGFDIFTQRIFGLTQYQSKVVNFGGIVVAICLLMRFFVRSEVIRFLSLWCVIMSVLIVPALLLTSQDAPLDRLRGQAGKIQEQQQERLQRAP